MKDSSCRTIKVRALQQGHTKVVATYDHGGINLQSSVTIATYDKLIVSFKKKSLISKSLKDF